MVLLGVIGGLGKGEASEVGVAPPVGVSGGNADLMNRRRGEVRPGSGLYTSPATQVWSVIAEIVVV